MLNSFIVQLEIIIRTYGALGVFVAAIAEEIIAPITSSLVAMFAGFFLIPAEYSWLQATLPLIFKVAVPMSFGITIGSLLFYLVAYWGGKPIILKYGKWFGLKWDLVEKLENKFAKTKVDEIALFGLRALPFVPSVAVSAFCGLVRYRLKTFIILTFSGSLVRSIIMAAIGWKGREFYLKFIGIFDKLETLILFVVIGVFLIFLYKHIKSSKF